jgi:hypothetical protein
VATKIKHALNEARTLVLVVQILIGMQFSGAFERGFERLPQSSRDLKLVSLLLELLCLGLLLWPAARHQIVEQGRDTETFHLWVTRVATATLLPFALALGIDVYVVGEHTLGVAGGVAAGAAAALFALGFWYGLPTLEGGRVWPEQHGHEEGAVSEPTKLETRVEQALTETRVVLPGVQALLAFQLTASLSEGWRSCRRRCATCTSGAWRCWRSARSC